MNAIQNVEVGKICFMFLKEASECPLSLSREFEILVKRFAD